MEEGNPFELELIDICQSLVSQNFLDQYLLLFCFDPHLLHLFMLFVDEIRGAQKTHRPANPDPAGLGRFLRLGGLGYKFFFIVGWVGFGS